MTDIREKIRSENDAFYNAFWGQMKAVWTAMPVQVQSSDGHKATAQSAINGTFVDPLTSTVTTGQIAPWQDMPIHYARGGGVSHTHPVVQGDEGIALFTARPMDSWFQNGGVNNNPVDDRTHSISDGRYLPGGNSLPMKLDPPASQASSQIRSDDGNHVNDVHPQNGLTHASTKKDLIIVNGQQGTGTLHGPVNKIVNTYGNGQGNLLVNTVETPGIPPPPPSPFGLLINQAQNLTGGPLPVAGVMAGQMSSVMASVLSGGASAIFTDPTAAINSALSNIVSTGAASLTSALGGAAATMVAAMTGSGGLTSALTTLATGTGSMSGVSAPTGGNFGLCGPDRPHQ